MPYYPRFGVIAALLGSTALLVAGCSSSGGTAEAAPDARPSASSPSSTDAAASGSASASSRASGDGATTTQEQAALAAYRGMIADWVAAGLTSNYQDPALAHHMSGSALSWVTRHLAVEQSEGAVEKGTPVLRNISFGQQVPASDPTEIVINSVFDDSNWLEYTSDGHLFNSTPGGCHKTQVLAQDESGTWKIDQLAMNAVGTC
jgi:hypothetical protein